MITFGYVKSTMYSGDGSLLIQVRIPSIHGAYKLSDYKGKPVRNYTPDSELPYYHSLLLPYLPNEGEVVAVQSLDKGNNNFIVIGLTGGSYRSGTTNLGG